MKLKQQFNPNLELQKKKNSKENQFSPLFKEQKTDRLNYQRIKHPRLVYTLKAFSEHSRA